MTSEFAKLILAIQFLTRLPVPAASLYTAARMAESVRYYPLVGLLVGGICAVAFQGASLIFPQPVSVILAMATGLLVTGGFHEDGLADTFDGIGGGQTREAALEIMRDSRLGTYGTLALIVALALKASALIALPAPLLLWVFPAAHGLSRLSSVAVIATSRYVRAEGKGKPVAEGTSWVSLSVAGVTGLAIVSAWLHGQPAMALVWGLAGLCLGHALMRAFFEFKLKGYAGDTLGAVQQASEIGFYLGVLLWL